jgi:hypothetical protein
MEPSETALFGALRRKLMEQPEAALFGALRRKLMEQPEAAVGDGPEAAETVYSRG